MAKRSNGYVYTESVIKFTKNEFREDIRQSLLGDRQMKKEINRVLQMANRRIQNLKKSGVASTALSDLQMARDINKYSVFSITGLKLTSKSDWELAKIEYGKALAFLNRPTSSALGAKQYVRYLANKRGINFDTMNAQIQHVINDMILNGYENKVQTSPILRELFGDIERDEKEMQEDSESYANDLENQLQDTINTTTETIFDMLRKM